MAEMYLVISDDTEKKFRKFVSQTLGMKKGNLSIAAEDALKAWNEKQERRLRK